MKGITRYIVFAALIAALAIGISGCNKSSENKANSDISQVLEYKGSYVGDNTAIVNIISNLPGNNFYEKTELQTKNEPYEIIINYKEFENAEVRLSNGELVSLPIKAALKTNGAITLALIENADRVSFHIDNGDIITYDRETLLSEYKDKYGNSLERLVSNKNSLDEFIKENKQSN